MGVLAVGERWPVQMQPMRRYAGPEADAGRQEARATSEATHPFAVAGRRS